MMYPVCLCLCILFIDAIFYDGLYHCPPSHERITILVCIHPRLRNQPSSLGAMMNVEPKNKVHNLKRCYVWTGAREVFGHT